MSVRQGRRARRRRDAAVRVDEVGVITGSDGNQLARSIAVEGSKDDGPAIALEGGRTSVGIRPRGSDRACALATLWLVRYDPQTRDVRIGRGENGGRVLPHRNIVTRLRKLGNWTGAATTFDKPAYRRANERNVAFVQQGPGGGTVAANKL